MPALVNLPPAILLMGPTCSGKSQLAVQLAHALDGEIISVDSALVYRGMDIGTAKPTIEERQGVPHHLIDMIDPSESFSTGQFRTQALSLMAEITQRGRLPILVGGTMLYFRALIYGIAQLPEADVDIRAKLDEEFKKLGKAALHERLMTIDPVAAARIHPNDPQRIQRALEVYELTGIPLTDYFNGEHQALPFRFCKLIVAPEHRKILHDKIAERFVNMLRSGFVAEVQTLFVRGDLSDAMPSVRCVGYRQIWSYLNGEYGYDEMINKGIAATRQLAKRQFTWLRRENEAYSFYTEQGDLLSQVMAVIYKVGIP